MVTNDDVARRLAEEGVDRPDIRIRMSRMDDDTCWVKLNAALTEVVDYSDPSLVPFLHAILTTSGAPLSSSDRDSVYLRYQALVSLQFEWGLRQSLDAPFTGAVTFFSDALEWCERLRDIQSAYDDKVGALWSDYLSDPRSEDDVWEEVWRSYSAEVDDANIPEFRRISFACLSSIYAAHEAAWLRVAEHVLDREYLVQEFQHGGWECVRQPKS